MLEILRKLKEILPNLDDESVKETWAERVPKLYEEISRLGLPVDLWIGDILYNCKDKKIEIVTGERLVYAPVTIPVSSPLGSFVFYKWGNYDIDQDIAHLESGDLEREEEEYERPSTLEITFDRELSKTEMDKFIKMIKKANSDEEFGVSMIMWSLTS